MITRPSTGQSITLPTKEPISHGRARSDAPLRRDRIVEDGEGVGRANGGLAALTRNARGHGAGRVRCARTRAHDRRVGTDRSAVEPRRWRPRGHARGSLRCRGSSARCSSTMTSSRRSATRPCGFGKRTPGVLSRSCGRMRSPSRRRRRLSPRSRPPPTTGPSSCNRFVPRRVELEELRDKIRCLPAQARGWSPRALPGLLRHVSCSGDMSPCH